MGTRRISVIIPTLNEEASIEAVLDRVQGMRSRGHEVIVVDGGSVDGTVVRARPLCDKLLVTDKGRGVQMRSGADVAAHEVFWFLHADTIVPITADRQILEGLAPMRDGWGRFDVRLSSRDPQYRVVEFLMNLRSRLSSIATGDQGIFVTRRVYDAAGGIPVIPVMEDIAFSRSLKRIVAPVCLRTRIRTSSRRWESHGVIATIFRMWALRLAYALGADPGSLARYYGDR